MTKLPVMVKRLKSGEQAITSIPPEENKLLRRLTTGDNDGLMTPKDEGRKLSTEQKALIRQSISSGAEWSAHWAYRPLNKTGPAEKDAQWIRNATDQFVLDKLNRLGS